MKIIQGITDAPNQQMDVLIEGGTVATLTLYYREQQQAWFYDINWNGNFICSGRQVVVHPNMLRQFRNLIPFGLAAFSPSNLEPLSQNAFADGTGTLVLLNATDVTNAESTFFPGL